MLRQVIDIRAKRRKLGDKSSSLLILKGNLERRTVLLVTFIDAL